MSTKKTTSTKIISDRLKLLLDESGIKKGVLAQKIKVSPGFITQLLSGESGASSQTISSLAREFKVSEDWLAYGTGEKHYGVIAVFEPETKKAEQRPITKAVLDLVEVQPEEIQAEAFILLSKFFSDASKPKKS